LFFSEFADEARSKNVGVLVHCLAGVSRSVTFTLAYLMFKLHLSLNDAFDFVRRRKGNIAPNFTFLGQLLEFERQQLPDLRKKHQELVEADAAASLAADVVLPRVRVLPGSISEDESHHQATHEDQRDRDCEPGATPGQESKTTDDCNGAGLRQDSCSSTAPFSATSPDSGIDFER
jgi:hypothetical protein